MEIAEILLALVQAGRLAKSIYDDYQAGAMTEEEALAAWVALKPGFDHLHERLAAIKAAQPVAPAT